MNKLIRYISSFDIWLISVIFSMLLFSIAMVSSAGGAMAIKQQWSVFLFMKKHLFFTFLSIIVMIICSSLNLNQINRLGKILFFTGLLGVIAALFIGSSIKGASRWLNIGGISWQPSETMKIGLVIIVANFIQEKQYKKLALYLIPSFILLILQPDLGSVILLASTLIIMTFLNDIPLKYFYMAAGALALIGLTAYLSLNHVYIRVNSFLFAGADDAFGSKYQILKGLQAIKNGGIYGKGPGEGIIKYYIPDSMTDFIFSIIAEEFGFLGCGIIITLYFIILWRIYIYLKNHLHKKESLIIIGLTALILLQAWFSMLSVLSLIPSKGFTLPFIGYGGSALLMQSCSMGFILSLTRRRLGDKILSKLGI